MECIAQNVDYSERTRICSAVASPYQGDKLYNARKLWSPEGKVLAKPEHANPRVFEYYGIR
jgi:hypothetical protein